ncbi:DNA polymerase, partial [Lactococcus lactis]
NYASIECVQRNLNPLTTSLCVMSRADHSKGLTLASSPTFKKVFGMKNVSRASDLPFLIETRKFNYSQWYRTHTDIHRQRTEPTLQYVAFIESWAKRTWIVPPQMQLYVDYKIEVTDILTNYTSIDEIHSYSIDESFLDITESLNFFYPGIKNRYEQMNRIALDLQREIRDKLGLYVTVGMGDNPLLAKLAMDNYAKHNDNMRALIRYEDVPNKLWTIPKMTDFWGIGKRTEKRLNKLGITSIKELANADPLL